MSSNIAFTGLASGLNTTALIQNVLRFNQQSISTLQTQVTTDQTQQTAFKVDSNRPPGVCRDGLQPTGSNT